jgi:peptidyl-dipeptidase Dcp
MLDMAWHSIQSSFKSNIIVFENENTKATSHLPILEGSSISTSFSHIFAGGYAVGYYGYKWAEVLDADAFSVFSKEGIFNKEIALKFRKEILEKGGTVQPQILYKNFRGKEATIDALLKRTGLN